MRVLLTGSTGFVGSFTVPALLARGHEVRLFVRDFAKAGSVLARRGVDVRQAAIEVAVGDMLDADAVERALDGCDAAVHAAAAIGITSGGAVSVHEQNVAGTANVVGGAVAAGLDPVVHVSTIAVFVPPRAPVITTDAPLASPRNEYGRSKVEAEHAVRLLQADGAPIAVVYPGGVLGPISRTSTRRSRASPAPAAPAGRSHRRRESPPHPLPACPAPGVGVGAGPGWLADEGHIPPFAG